MTEADSSGAKLRVRIQDYTQTQEIVHVNSRQRLSGSDSDFVYEIRPRAEFDRVVVLNAQIPKSYYLVAAPYNTFVLDEGGVLTTITFRPGNYSRRSFQSELNSLLAAEAKYTYSVSYPDAASEPDTGKYTYTVTNNPVIEGHETQPKFIFRNSLYEQFGFERNTVNTFVDNKIISSNVIKFQVEDTLFLYSDMVGGENKSNILQEFFAASQTNFSNITYTCPDPKFYSRKILNIAKSTFEFKLLDEDGQAIDLNGLNMVFTLLLYKKGD